ncbi:MAG: orotate phosphoribosyltransferase [Acidobacteria bacterium]|nr:MAG: orotate phosphoribosyltransferase [Acidobacteriota bacterium]
MAAGEPLLDHLRSALALALWREDAVRVRPDEPFRLASGNASPIYVDCRRAIASPELMRLFTAAAGELIAGRRLPCDVIAGGETAGIPFAAFLAAALARPMAYARKKAKGYGTGSRLEGRVVPGDRVLLVEDLITDGGSKLTFLDAIEEAGASVAGVLVLFDRQQGGAALLAERGVDLHALCDLDAALDAGQAAGLLSAAERRDVDAYRRDPAAWHAARGLRFRPA